MLQACYSNLKWFTWLNFLKKFQTYYWLSYPDKLSLMTFLKHAFPLKLFILPNNVFIMSNNNEIKWKPLLVYMFYLIIETYLKRHVWTTFIVRLYLLWHNLFDKLRPFVLNSVDFSFYKCQVSLFLIQKI